MVNVFDVCVAAQQDCDIGKGSLRNDQRIVNFLFGKQSGGTYFSGSSFHDSMTQGDVVHRLKAPRFADAVYRLGGEKPRAFRFAIGGNVRKLHDYGGKYYNGGRSATSVGALRNSQEPCRPLRRDQSGHLYHRRVALDLPWSIPP